MNSNHACWCGQTELADFSPDYLFCENCQTLAVGNWPPAERFNVSDDASDFYGRSYYESHVIETIEPTNKFVEPAISIVVPGYNQRPEFVSECLASIFTQEGATYEVTFVDGLSNPETLATAEPFRERCAHFIFEADGQVRQAFSTSRRATDWRGWKPSKSSRKE